jgi:hypothetical protein
MSPACLPQREIDVSHLWVTDDGKTGNQKLFLIDLENHKNLLFDEDA